MEVIKSLRYQNLIENKGHQKTKPLYKESELYELSGPNGAGKSTTICLLESSGFKKWMF